MRPRRCSGPTTSSTRSPPASGPRTTPAPCGCRAGSTSVPCGSTPTSRSSPRCRTAASSTPATARTSRCTASRTTRASSTSCPTSRPEGLLGVSVDLVLHGGTVVTGLPGGPRARAVAVHDGFDVALDDDALGLLPIARHTIDLEGGALLASFGDGHVHPLWGGVELTAPE